MVCLGACHSGSSALLKIGSARAETLTGHCISSGIPCHWLLRIHSKTGWVCTIASSRSPCSRILLLSTSFRSFGSAATHAMTTCCLFPGASKWSAESLCCDRHRLMLVAVTTCAVMCRMPQVTAGAGTAQAICVENVHRTAASTSRAGTQAESSRA